jgi:superoxide dismutase
VNQFESNRIIEDLQAKQIESNRIIEELTAKQNDTIEKLNETKRILAETKATASGFLRNHILYESWLGKKKSESNRNGHESLMNQLAERVKQGETITVDEYLKRSSKQ